MFYRLTCRCNEKAKALGYDHFSLRFWGICMGINNLNKQRSPSEACSNGKYKPCFLDSAEECVGKGDADFIYHVGETCKVETT